MDLSAQDRGAKFEEHVGRLLELLGFSVRRDVLVKGRQADLVATKGGVFPTTYIVECKDHATRMTVTQLESLFSRVQSARASGDPTVRGIFVTTIGFVKAVREQAPTLGIDLITASELERSLLDLRPLVEEQVEVFQRDRGVSGFVEPHIRLDGRSDSEPALSVLSMWLRNTRQNHLSLLGDFGTGKTTLLRRIAVDIGMQYLKNSAAAPAPIYVDLREFSHVVSIRQIILDLLDRYRVTLSSYETFWHVLLAGRVVLLLDGFDELISKSNLNTTMQNFREINKAALQRAKIVVSCRRHYFVNDSEVRDLYSHHESLPSIPAYTELYREVAGRPSFQIFHLEEFNESQISELVTLRRGAGMVGEVRDMLARRYNLLDLARRPVLLDMILESLDQIATEETTITSAVLYQVYTDIWLQRNDWNTSLTPDARARLIEEFAGRVALEPETALHYAEIPRLVITTYPELDRVTAEQCDRELRRAGFLVRDEQGSYRFSHRSFYEFFLARFIVRIIREGSAVDSTLSDRLPAQLTTEVYRFVCDLVSMDEHVISKAIERLSNHPSNFAEAIFVIKFISRTQSPRVIGALESLVDALKGHDEAREVSVKRASPKTRALAVAISALGWLERLATPQRAIELLADKDESYVVRHNALVALLRSQHGAAADALAGFIEDGAPHEVVQLMGSNVVTNALSGDSGRGIANAVVARCGRDVTFREVWVRSSSAASLCRCCGLSNLAEARRILKIVVGCDSTKSVSAALDLLDDEELREVEELIENAARRWKRGLPVSIVRALRRLGTDEALDALIQVVRESRQGTVEEATSELASWRPDILASMLFDEYTLWRGKHWCNPLRLKSAVALAPRYPEEAGRELVRLVGKSGLGESQKFEALQFLTRRAPQDARVVIERIWEKDRRHSAALLGYAVECLYQLDRRLGRQFALRRGLSAQAPAVRARVARVLTSDTVASVTTALVKVIGNDDDRGVRVEAARALVAPGRAISPNALRSLRDKESDGEVRSILELPL